MAAERENEFLLRKNSHTGCLNPSGLSIRQSLLDSEHRRRGGSGVGAEFTHEALPHTNEIA